jgi:hypothetical protein
MNKNFLGIVIFCFAIIVLTNFYDFSDKEGLTPAQQQQEDIRRAQQEMENKLNAARKEVEAAKNELNKAKDMYKRAEGTIKQDQEAIKRYQNSVRDYENKLKNLTALELRERKEIVDLHKTITREEREKRTLSDKNSKLNKENNKLASDLDKDEKKIIELKLLVDLYKPPVTLVDYIDHVCVPLITMDKDIFKLYNNLQKYFTPQALDAYTIATTTRAFLFMQGELQKELNRLYPNGNAPKTTLDSQIGKNTINMLANDSRLKEFVYLPAIQKFLNDLYPFLVKHYDDENSKLHMPAKNAIDLIYTHNLLKNTPPVS